MRRLFWTAVGAAGGIYAYRRGQQLLADTRARGLPATLATATTTAAALLDQGRTRAWTGRVPGAVVPGAVVPGVGRRAPGTAAARVLAEARRATPPRVPAGAVPRVPPTGPGRDRP